MKRKQIYQNLHPFTSHPFEAFFDKSWHPVEQLSISGGFITTKIVQNSATVEEKIPFSHLRVKSRKAVLADCTFLRQGVDVCVLTTLKDYEKADDKEDSSSEPVWLDAKIRSMKRIAHDEGQCRCEFYVSFYLEQGPHLITGNKKLSRETSTVNIDRISILQKLELNPSEDEFYRWGFSEDCFLTQKPKLFSGKFFSDISWLLVSSVLKQTSFNVLTVQNHLVYEVLGYKPDVNASHALNFKVENDVSTPIMLPIGSESSLGEEAESYDVIELRRSKRRIVQPDRYLGCDKNIPDYDMEVTRLGESKSHKLGYNEISSDSETDDDDDDLDDNTLFSPLSVQADAGFQRYRGAKDWYKASRRNSLFYKRRRGLGMREYKKYMRLGCRNRYEASKGEKEFPEEDDAGFDENGFPNFKMPRGKTSEQIEEMVERYFYPKKSSSSEKKKPFDSDLTDMDGGIRTKFGTKFKVSRKKYTRTGNFGYKRDCFYVRDSIYDVRSFRKDSVTARVCRELIRRCMLNIDDTLKNGPDQSSVVDNWKAFESDQVSNAKVVEEKAETKEEELSEIDMLWKEMELAMASWYLEDNEDSRVETKSEAKNAREIRQEICKHELRLNDEVGMVCQLCGFLETDIKDILPPFAENIKQASWTQNKVKESRDKTEPNNSNQELEDQLSVPTTSTTLSTIGGKQKNVWALIPELKDKLRPHQKKAFKFLWRNIAGSLSPAQMLKRKAKTGGCVVSHTPGAGKTLLVIAFLVSYLKLFPGSRPLVLAPKTTLYTWYKEIIKWNVGVPVYQIHGGQTYKGEVLKQRMRLPPGLPRNQDVLHVLDCLEKMKCWLSHPSILLMGYTSFLTLTREDSNYAHRKYMAQLLKQCPGIMILDEGHNPRSTKSRLRKGLMKVNTRLRILLSGTLFQNNFGEYFNTLNLARPVFADEVIDTLDPKYDKANKSAVTIENRGRKLLIDKVSKKIDSKNDGERAQALKTHKKLTSKFIDVYEGAGSTDELPGLECYTLMMKATSVQLDILSKLQDKRSEQTKFPLDVEFLITLSAIHPWLITTSICSKTYFSESELGDFEKFKLDVKCGSKVRFVMNLIPRCLLRNEKVLIFCHNISPINLFLQLFERFLGWQKGREVLVLQGDIELFERGRVIDMFEEPNGPSKVMLASITACAEGISLTAASRVILLDSEWNPAKSKQAIARAFRPGQTKVVYVYQLLATGTLEEEKHGRTTWKEWVSDMIFSDELVEDPSHWQAPKMEDELLKEIVEEDRASLFHKIMKNEKASNVIRGKGLLKNGTS